MPRLKHAAVAVGIGGEVGVVVEAEINVDRVHEVTVDVDTDIRDTLIQPVIPPPAGARRTYDLLLLALTSATHGLGLPLALASRW